jgi:hypothetical protein
VKVVEVLPLDEWRFAERDAALPGVEEISIVLFVAATSVVVLSAVGVAA